MDPVELLQSMLEIESLSTKESRLARFLVERMTALEFSARVDEAGNAVGVREAAPPGAGAGPREIVLLGHMDTVPGTVPVRREGDLLYGRGAVDAKGPLAAFIIAAATADLPAGLRVVVIGAVEEECATSKGARHAAGQYRPDFCIIGEPSGWDAVTLGYKGRLLARYRLARSMSHTAGPDTPVAESAVAFWNEIAAHARAFNAGRTALFDQLMPSLREMRTTSDGLTERVEATIGFRLPPDLDGDALAEIVRGFAGEAAVEFVGKEPAYRADSGTPLVRAFTTAIRAIGGAGTRPTFKLKTGTSDMNVVGPVWGCPMVAYGPGDSRLDHTPDEHVAVSEYLRAIEVLRAALRSL